MMSETLDIPRTLLLTLWPPDAKYKILYKNVACLDADKIACATLQQAEPSRTFPFRYRAFPPRQPYWRLRPTSLGLLLVQEWQSGVLARAIAKWAGAFEPEVLWVLPELGAASVGRHLKRLLRIPLHVTVHDAHETARHIVPPLYYRCYAASVRRCLASADGADAICGGMRAYLGEHFANLHEANMVVVPPSMPTELINAVAKPRRWHDPTRRIGLCGSMRVTAEQWARFLDLLAALPYACELVTFAYDDLFPEVPMPDGVRLVRRPFAETEKDMIAAFHEAGCDAFYLGLYQEPHRALFGRTSLSAKLATYAAAALPVIVDAREDASAWTLVRDHGAGIRIGHSRDEDVAALRDMFGDRQYWDGLAQGARRLALEAMHLDTNMQKLAAALRRLAGGDDAGAA